MLVNNSTIYPTSSSSSPSIYIPIKPIRNIESKAVTTRWPSTPAEANLSGGRWRVDSSLHQGAGFELPSSKMFSTSPVAMTLSPTSPRSWPGIQWLSLGNRLATLLWGDTSTQLLSFQIQLLLCFVKIENWVETSSDTLAHILVEKDSFLQLSNFALIMIACMHYFLLHFLCFSLSDRSLNKC